MVVAPPLVGWLVLRGQRRGWYDGAAAVSLLVLVLTSLSAVLLVRTAQRVKEADDETVLTHRAMLMMNAHLEEAVEARTEELAHVQARLTAAFASSPLGTAFTAVDGTILEVNPVFSELASAGADQLVGTNIDALFGSENAAEEAVLRATMLAGAGSYAIERPMRRGSVTRWVKTSVALIEDQGGRHGTLYHLEDVTARRKAEERVQHLALHDSLTDLPNRLLLLDRVSLALAHATRSRRGVGVLFLDLDGFKQINDTHGHQAGDMVLTEVARRLRGSVRLSDTVARLGGDEFVVVCPDMASPADLPTIAGVLARAVTRPILLDGLEVQVGASIGITFGTAHDDPEILLRQADQAMYRAKERGDGGFALHEDPHVLVPSQRLEPLG
jgi:diguanylate cyclase (GGDEF)-like protein/PAS domain S-box-containing protein